MIGKKGQELMMRALQGQATGAELVEYLNSPEYQRHKAERDAEDLKRHRAGRARLLELIEAAKAAGTTVDYERVQLRDGHDSLMVTIGTHPKYVCTGFPSFYGPETIEEGFADLLQHYRELHP